MNPYGLEADESNMEKTKYTIRGLIIGILVAIPMLFAFQNCGQAPGSARVKSAGGGEKILIVTGFREPCINQIDQPCEPLPPEPDPEPSPQPSPVVEPSPGGGGGTVRCRKRCVERDPETGKCVDWLYRCTGEIEN